MIFDLSDDRFDQRGFYFPSDRDIVRIKDTIRNVPRSKINDLCRSTIHDKRCVGLHPDLCATIECELRNALKSPDAEVVFVGSAKVGCKLVSVEPERPQFSPFSIESDIDCAVINSDIFDEIWLSAFEAAYTGRPWRKRTSLDEFVFKGWLRPDKIDSRCKWRDRWFDLARDVTQNACPELKVTVGIYKSRPFLERYQVESFEKAHQILELS